MLRQIQQVFLNIWCQQGKTENMRDAWLADMGEARQCD